LLGHAFASSQPLNQHLPIGGRASQGAAAIPLSTAENCIYAPENCRVGIKNLVEISLLNASGRAGRQRKSGARFAGRQRTGSGIQRHGLSLVEELRTLFGRAGAAGEIELCPGVHHGFAFPQRWCYDKPAAERHWERLIALYRWPWV
jgi:hypothetical protein